MGGLSAAELEVHDAVHAHLPNVLQPLRSDVFAKLHAEAGRQVRLGVCEPDVKWINNEGRWQFRQGRRVACYQRVVSHESCCARSLGLGTFFQAPRSE